jgi:hypothetical protein
MWRMGFTPHLEGRALLGLSLSPLLEVGLKLREGLEVLLVGNEGRESADVDAELASGGLQHGENDEVGSVALVASEQLLVTKVGNEAAEELGELLSMELLLEGFLLLGVLLEDKAVDGGSGVIHLVAEGIHDAGLESISRAEGLGGVSKHAVGLGEHLAVNLEKRELAVRGLALVSSEELRTGKPDVLKLDALVSCRDARHGKIQ